MRVDERIEELRIPPMSIEAEQAVLGGLMLAPDAFDIVADIVVEADFYRRDHQLIFAGIRALAEKNKPYDAVTLGEWFEAHGQAEQVAGGAYLIELASTTPSAANIKAYAEIVRDKSLLRKMIEVGTQIVNDGFVPAGRETSELLASAENAVLTIGGASVAEIEPAELGLQATVTELARRRAAGANALLGVTSGIDLLDELTLGWQPGLIIVAARPSMGKTALALSLRRAAAHAGARPGLWSLEMNKQQLFMRDIAAVGRVDYNHVQRPARATPEEMERMRVAIAKLRRMPMWMDDTPSLTVNQLVARLRRAKRQFDIKIAFIDYLQFIDLGQAKNGIAAAIQEVTRKLRAAAMTLGIPIVLLSQLNRALESRSDKRPIMSDLRESGAIEQDADVVMFLHRQGYYERDWARDDPRQSVAELILGKVRTGETGMVTVNWQGRYQAFGNMSYSDIPPDYREQRGGFEARPTHGLVSGT